MTNTLDQNINQQIKGVLGISDDLPFNVLYDKLYDYRNSQHPDKFQNEEAKTIAEENFKKAGELLNKLKGILEKELTERKPSEVVAIRESIELINVKSDNVNYQEQIQNLKSEITSNEYRIKSLKKTIKSLRTQKAEKKSEELISLYKPSKQRLITLGAAFVFTMIMSFLTKVEEIALFISKYSPFNEKYIHLSIFLILLFIPFRVAWVYIKQRAISELSRKILTAPFIRDFKEYIENSDSFTETQVHDYLNSKLVSKSSVIRFFTIKLFKLHTEVNIDSLKDIFIYTLLSKQLIEISRANRLERNFTVIKPYSWEDDFDDDDEEEENE